MVVHKWIRMLAINPHGGQLLWWCKRRYLFAWFAFLQNEGRLIRESSWLSNNLNNPLSYFFYQNISRQSPFSSYRYNTFWSQFLQLSLVSFFFMRLRRFTWNYEEDTNMAILPINTLGKKTSEIKSSWNPLKRFSSEARKQDSRFAGSQKLASVARTRCITEVWRMESKIKCDILLFISRYIWSVLPW